MSTFTPGPELSEITRRLMAKRAGVAAVAPLAGEADEAPAEPAMSVAARMMAKRRPAEPAGEPVPIPAPEANRYTDAMGYGQEENHPEPAPKLSRVSDLARTAGSTNLGMSNPMPSVDATPAMLPMDPATEQATAGQSRFQRAIVNPLASGLDAAMAATETNWRKFTENAGRGPSRLSAPTNPGSPIVDRMTRTDEEIRGQMGEIAQQAPGITRVPAELIGGTIGGIADPAQLSMMALGGVAGKAAGKALGPITGRIAAQAGDDAAPVVKQALDQIITGSAGFGSIGAYQTAISIPSEQWQADPLGSLRQVAEAAGETGLVGGIMTAAGAGLAARGKLRKMEMAAEGPKQGVTAIRDVQDAYTRAREAGNPVEASTLPQDATVPRTTPEATEAVQMPPDPIQQPPVIRNRAPAPARTPDTETVPPVPLSRDSIGDTNQPVAPRDPTHAEAPAQRLPDDGQDLQHAPRQSPEQGEVQGARGEPVPEARAEEVASAPKAADEPPAPVVDGGPKGDQKPVEVAGQAAKSTDLVAKLTAKADELKARRRSRVIPRGRNVGAGTIIEDIVDLAHEYALRATAAGIKGGKQLSEFVRTQLADEAKEFRDQYAKIRTTTRGMLRKATGKDGEIDGDRLLDIRAAIAKEEPTLTESEALVAGLKKSERAAAKAYREGRASGIAETRAKIPAMIQKIDDAGRVKAMRGAITERLKGGVKLERQQAKAATIQGLQQEVRKLAEENLPLAIRGKFLSDVANAKSLGNLRRSVVKMRRELAAYELRSAIRDTEKVMSRANLKKMFEDYRKVIEDARKELDSIRVDPRTLEVYRTAEAMETAAARAAELKNAVIEARHRDKADRQILAGGKAVKVDAAMADLEQGLASRKDLMMPASDLPRDREAGLLGRARQAMWTPDSVGAAMKADVARKVLAEDAWDGETLVNRDVQRADDALKENLKAGGYEWGSDKLQRLSEFAAGKEAEKLTLNLPDAGDIAATPAEWMALYATMTDKGAGANIAGGAPIRWRRARGENSAEFTLSGSDRGYLMYHLDPELRKIVDRAKDYIEKEIRPGLFEAFRDQKGYDLIAVENYWRTVRDMKAMEAAGLEGPMRQFFNRSLENLGFLKERAPDIKKPYLVGDFFQDFHDIAHKGAVVTHMTRRVRAAELIFKQKRARDLIQAKFGKGMNDRLDRIIEDMKLIFVEPKTPFEKAAAVLNKNMAKSLLTLNPSTFAKQIGGVFKLYGVMDAKDLAAGAAKAYSPEVSKILKESPFFRNRYDDSIWRRVTPALGERTPLLGQSTALESAKRLATVNPKRAVSALYDLSDRITILNTFDAASSRTAIAAKLAEAERIGIAPDKRAEWAAREAEYAIRRTQNSSSPLDMSGFAAQHRGSLASSFIMFTSDSNKSYNMLATAASEGKVRKAATAIALNNAWAAAVTAALGPGIYVAGRAIAGDKRSKTEKAQDEKRPGVGEAFARAFIKNTGGMVYFGDRASDVLAAIADEMLGRPAIHRQVMDTPAEGTIEEALRGIVTIAGAATDEGKFKSGPRKGQDRAVAHALEGAEKTGLAVSQLLGLPIGPAYRMGKRVYDAIE